MDSVREWVGNNFFLLPVVIVVLFMAAGIGVVAFTPIAKPVYRSSEFVKTVIGGHRGQVIRARCNERDCWYDVRFDALQLRTNTRLLGDDDPITFAPVSEVRGMHAFELEPVR